MPQGKFKPSCGKMTYNTLQGAWEHVVYFRRQGKGWQQPYLCKCGKYHLTRKHFQGKVPAWVKTQSTRQLKKEKKRRERNKDHKLSIAKQRLALKQINNQPASVWLRIKNLIWG